MQNVTYEVCRVFSRRCALPAAIWLCLVSQTMVRLTTRRVLFTFMTFGSMVYTSRRAGVKMSKKKSSKCGVFKCPVQKLVFSQWTDDDKHTPVINDHYFNHAVRM
jgi:hypothetical protein